MLPHVRLAILQRYRACTLRAQPSLPAKGQQEDESRLEVDLERRAPHLELAGIHLAVVDSVSVCGGPGVSAPYRNRAQRRTEPFAGCG